MENSVSSLTTDLWMEILLRVPAEYLIQLKGVCKFWHELINNKQFAGLHLDHWRSNHGLISSIMDAHTPKELCLLSFSMDGKDLNPRICNLQDLLGQLYHSDWKYFITLDSCDGLLLIRTHTWTSNDLLLCNPVTRTYRILPECRTPNSAKFGPRKNGGLAGKPWTLLYDASARRYKVVGFGNRRRTCFIYIFELHEDEKDSSDWKEFAMPIAPQHWIRGNGAHRKDGKLVFLTTYEEAREDRRNIWQGNVVVFDISKEEFKSPQTRWFGEPSAYVFRCDSNGTFYCFDQIAIGCAFNLWTLKSFDDNPTWSAERRFFHGPIPVDLEFHRSFALIEILEDGRKLLLHYSRWGEIAVYEMKCKTRMIPIKASVTAKLKENRFWSCPVYFPIYHVNSVVRWK